MASDCVESFLTFPCARITAADCCRSAYNYTMAQQECYGSRLALHDQQIIDLRNGVKLSLEESATAVSRRVRTTVVNLRHSNNDSTNIKALSIPRKVHS